MVYAHRKNRIGWSNYPMRSRGERKNHADLCIPNRRWPLTGRYPAYTGLSISINCCRIP